MIAGTKASTKRSVEGPAYTFFVVWQPKQIHVTFVPFQKDYYTKELEPLLERWYFDKFLPMAVLKHNGLLVKNTTQASAIIDCS